MGIIVTLTTVLLTFFVGAIAGIVILRWVWGNDAKARTAFPFIDELLLASKMFNAEIEADPKSMKLTQARAIRQGLWLIAWAIVTGLAFSGLLDLIGNLATPAG